MFYYFTLYFLVALYAYAYSLNRNKLLLFIPLLLMALFSGFRYDAGNDFFTYLSIIKTGVGLDRLEPLNIAIIYIGDFLEYQYFYYFVTSFIVVFSLGYFCIRESIKPEYAILMFLILPLSYLTSFGYIRQYVSISFFILSMSFFIDRKYVVAILLLILALLSHKSVLLFLWLYFSVGFLQRRIYSVWTYVTILICFYFSGNIILFIGEHLDIYSHYLSEDKLLSNGKNMWFACVVIFIYLFFNKGEFKSSKDTLYFNIFFLFIAIYLAMINMGEYVIRVVYFLFPFSYVCIANSFVSGRFLLFKKIFMVCYGTVLFILTLNLAKNNPTRDFLTNISFSFLQ